MTDVVTVGSFDMLHPGHLGLFAECRYIADAYDPVLCVKVAGRVVVGVNTDEFVTRFKREPVYSTEERAALVKALRDVDGVFLNDGSSQPELIASQLPHGGHLVVGGDWAPGNPDGKDYLTQIGFSSHSEAYEFFALHSIKLTFTRRHGRWSSTDLILRRARHRELDRD